MDGLLTIPEIGIDQIIADESQAGYGFVEQEQPRSAEEGAAELHELFLAAR
jgi:hypothetical protein